MARLLADSGDVVTLTARADNGDQKTADQLSWLLAARGDVQALTARAARGDPDTAERMAELLDGHNETTRRRGPTALE